MSEPLPCPPASRPGPLGARPVLPPGHRAYAIGDVHGCLDRLRALHALIAADLAARPVARPVLIHMGDLIDRGTDSAGVVALLAAGSPIRGVPTLNLSGNHEQMLLEVLSIGTRQVAEHWLANGGDATLRSWGVPHRAPAKDWPALLPSEHLAFVRALLPLHRIGSWLYGLVFRSTCRPMRTCCGSVSLSCLMRGHCCRKLLRSRCCMVIPPWAGPISVAGGLGSTPARSRAVP
jgi:hypothetical protein